MWWNKDLCVYNLWFIFETEGIWASNSMYGLCNSLDWKLHSKLHCCSNWLLCLHWIRLQKIVCVSLPVREICSIFCWEIDFPVSFMPPWEISRFLRILLNNIDLQWGSVFPWFPVSMSLRKWTVEDLLKGYVVLLIFSLFLLFQGKKILWLIVRQTGI